MLLRPVPASLRLPLCWNECFFSYKAGADLLLGLSPSMSDAMAEKLRQRMAAKLAEAQPEIL